MRKEATRSQLLSWVGGPHIWNNGKQLTERMCIFIGDVEAKEIN